MLEAFLSRDASADGRFLTAVLTTGIYCRPSCPAKKPRPENVRFYETEADARAAGFRPCRRCKPDQFHRQHDADAARLAAVVDAVRADPGRFHDASDIARAVACGASKLNTLFRVHYHTTPAEFLTQARIAATCEGLARNGRNVLDIAYAAGFRSVSAFNVQFRASTGLTPTEYRALGKETRFAVRLPADYRAEYTLRQQGRDPESPVEKVDGRSFVKVLHRAGPPLIVRVQFDRGFARCEVTSLTSVSGDDMRRAHAVVLRILGLVFDPAGLERRVARNRTLRPLVNGRAGLRMPLMSDPFEALIWGIVGQQVNLPFAYKLRRVIIELAGTDAGNGMRAHPDAHAVAALDYADLTRRQFSRRKAEYVIDTARAIAVGDLDLDALAAGPATAAERRLLEVRGLGPWSAQYMLMRGFGFADCVPAGDSGLATALERFFRLEARPDAVATRRLMEAFAPHRTLATFHFWTSLGDSP